MADVIFFEVKGGNAYYSSPLSDKKIWIILMKNNDGLFLED
ncbi:hypothetical protein ACIQXV_10670 [Neobacillus sp. NPDC097160]